MSLDYQIAQIDARIEMLINDAIIELHKGDRSYIDEIKKLDANINASIKNNCSIDNIAEYNVKKTKILGDVHDEYERIHKNTMLYLAAIKELDDKKEALINAR